MLFSIGSVGSLFFTIGISNSGKSTLAKQWAIHDGRTLNPMSLDYRPRVVLSADNFRDSLLGREYHFAAEGVIRESILLAASSLLRAGYDVLIDDTHTTSHSLLDIFKIDLNAQHLYQPCHLDVAVKRAADAGRHHLIPVIERHYANLMLNYDRYRGIDNWVEAIRKEAAHLHKGRSLSG